MKIKVYSPRLPYAFSIITFLFIGIISGLLFQVSALANSADDLAKSANTMIRNAERKMYEGKIDQSVNMLEQAQTTLDTLKASNPSHPQLKSLESKYSRIKKLVDKKLAQNDIHTTTPLPSKVTSPPMGEKLPAGVSKRIKDINRDLGKVENYLARANEPSVKQAEYQLKETQNLFEEIDSNYGNKFDSSHVDYASTKERFDRLKEKCRITLADLEKKKAGAMEDQAANEKLCNEWIPRFQAYLSYPGNEGHDPDKLVYIPGTSEPEKFADAIKRYEAFKAFYATYKNVNFPNGKDWKLETLADKDAPQRLADFEKKFSDRMNTVAGDAEKQISQAMAQLEKDKSWENDPKAKPALVDKKWMASIDNRVKNMEVALGKDSKEALKINKSYADLIAKDQKHRKIRAERTFLSPDAYNGNDKKDLLEKAGNIVVQANPGSKIMDARIYKGAWEEKTVEGWTDTTKTKWEKKTFKQINAQVAAKDSYGVYLHILHLARDKTLNGWGGIYGHIMFSDPMAEKNIGK